MNRLKNLNKLSVLDKLKKIDYSISHDLKKSILKNLKYNLEYNKIESKLENQILETKKPIGGGFKLNTKYFKPESDTQIRNMKYIKF